MDLSPLGNVERTNLYRHLKAGYTLNNEKMPDFSPLAVGEDG